MFTLSFVLVVWLIAIPLSRIYPAVLDYSLTVFRLWPAFFILVNISIKNTISKVGQNLHPYASSPMITGPCVVLIGVLGTKLFSNFDKLIIPFGLIILILLGILWITFIFKMKKERRGFLKALPSFCWDEIRGVIWLLILLPLAIILTILQIWLVFVTLILRLVFLIPSFIFNCCLPKQYIVHFKDTFLYHVFSYSKNDSV